MKPFVTADQRAETLANLRLAGPLVLAQLSFMGFGVIDTLIAAVRNGELDTVLSQVKRPPMQKKKAA